MIQDGGEWSKLTQKHVLTHRIHELAVDDAHMEALSVYAPYFDMGVPQIPTLLLIRNDVPDEDAFNVVSTITDPNVIPMEYYPQLTAEGFPSGAKGIPYHPVAAEWFGI